LASAQSLSEGGHLAASLMPRVRHRSEAVDVDRGQLIGRRLEDVAIVVNLDELGPVGGWPASRRDARRLERFATMREGMTLRSRSHPGLRLLANLRFEVSRLLPAVFSQPDVTTAVRARQWKLLPDPRHQLGPGNPRGVVRPGLLMCVSRVAAASRGVTAAPMPAGHGLLPLADFGHQRLWVLLRREGWVVNKKLVESLYREEGHRGGPAGDRRRRRTGLGAGDCRTCKAKGHSSRYRDGVHPGRLGSMGLLQWREARLQ